MKLSDQERSGLSEQEVAALEADLSEDEQRGATTKAADSDAKDEEKTGDAKAADDKGAASATDASKDSEKKDADATAAGGEAKDDKKDGAAAADTATDGEDKDPGDKRFAVPFVHTPTVKAEEVKAKLEALDKAFDAGDIDRATYNAHRDAVRDVALRDRIASDISASSQEQTAQALWLGSVEDFLDTHPIYKGDEVLYDALNERVKRLASDEKNANMSDRKLLGMAHEQIASRFKIEDDKKGAAVKGAQTEEEKKAAVAEKRKPDLSDVPRTIAAAPAAAGNETADDEFASIDRLAQTDSAAYEVALAKMPKDQQDRYLRGAFA